MSTLVALLLTVVSIASTAHANEYENVSFSWENDSFLGNQSTDKWFTNSLRLQWTHKNPSESLINQWLLGLPKALVGLQGDPSRTMKTGASLGQVMYTPSRLNFPRNDPSDRPYAGWAYYGVMAQTESGNVVRTSELRVGVVGPASLAGTVQRAWHELIHSQEPKGWDNQVRPFLGLQLGYTHHQALPSLTQYVNVVPFASAQVGTIKNYIGVGLVMVVGSAVNALAAGGGGEGDSQTLVGFSGKVNSSRRKVSDWRLLGFAEIEARRVFSNKMVTGDRFGGPSFIELTPNMRQGSYGVSVDLGDWRVALAKYLRSTEFTSPRPGLDKTQQFLMMSITRDY
jgi:lipid A 3-O-deacylase